MSAFTNNIVIGIIVIVRSKCWYRKSKYGISYDERIIKQLNIQ